MGCGSYSDSDAVARSHSYRSQSIEKTFSKKNLDPEMNPLNINFRESCDSEDPHMCWYFAANHIKTDALEKRGIKGCLITISDEPIHKTLPKEAVTHYIGDECGEDLATSFIYRECAEKWDIYHIHVEHGGYYGVERVSNSWKPYVGDNLIISDKEHVGESIARIVSNSYGQQTNS